MVNLDIFPLISLSDIVSINLVTWYWNLSVSVHQTHYDITDKSEKKCQFWRTRHTLSLVSQLILSDSLWF